MFEPCMPGGDTLLHELSAEKLIVVATSTDLTPCAAFASAVLRKLRRREVPAPSSCR